MSDPETMAWLLEGDPSVVWQVQRDLLGLSHRTWETTRRRVAKEGWGARLLALRGTDGRWGGGLYSPKWTSTFYTLRLLCHLGLPPTNREGVASCRLLLDEGVTESGGVSLWTSPYTDTCVTAMLVTMACYFRLGQDPRIARMMGWLMGERMRDGGWNCQRHRGARHSSFHTTISTLEALAAYEASARPDAEMLEASARAREFFLEHRLYRSSRTGEVVRPSFTQLSFPPRWFFDVLRGLEHFRAVDAPLDPRLDDALEVVRSRAKRGRWSAGHQHSGLIHFRLEEPRRPSRMNTVRALRVLRWAER